MRSEVAPTTRHAKSISSQPASEPPTEPCPLTEHHGSSVCKPYQTHRDKWRTAIHPRLARDHRMEQKQREGEGYQSILRTHPKRLLQHILNPVWRIEENKEGKEN